MVARVRPWHGFCRDLHFTGGAFWRRVELTVLDFGRLEGTQSLKINILSLRAEKPAPMIHISVIVWALCMLQSVSAFAPEPSKEKTLLGASTDPSAGRLRADTRDPSVGCGLHTDLQQWIQCWEGMGAHLT